MKKGWNREYIISKIEEYEGYLSLEQDENLRGVIEDEIGLYRELYETLMQQENEVPQSFTVERFLSSFYLNNNDYIYSTKYNKYLKYLYDEIIKLERLKETSYEEKIEREEALALVLEFIKETFGEFSYQVYKKYFLKNDDFILFDVCGTSFVTATEKDRFICLTSEENIELAASIAHEAGHIRRNFDKDIVRYESFLEEYESYAYEISFLRWLIKNNIHKQEAIKYLVNIISFMEKCLMMRIINNRYKLSKIKNVDYFFKRVDELNVREFLGIKDDEDLCVSIASSLSTDIATYYYSFISVLNHLDNNNFMKYYHDIISNVKLIPDYVLLRRDKINPNDLNNYRMLRKQLTDML